MWKIRFSDFAYDLHEYMDSDTYIAITFSNRAIKLSL